MSDTPGFIETQFCFDGRWVTDSAMQVAPDHIIAKETVWDPRDDRYNLAAAEAFFGIVRRNPYSTAETAKTMLDKITDRSELTELKVALADARSQAEIGRQGTRRSDGCQVRSTLYSERDTRFRGYWTTPQSTAAPGLPSQIDYVMSPDLPLASRIAVLNAIEQYSAAVAAQDALGMYPTKIVPHDPSDPRKPTITFSPTANTGEFRARTLRDPGPRVTGTPHPWVSGTVELTELAEPWVVGHEIGHVLGIDHLPNGYTFGTMPGVPVDREPWTPDILIDDPASQAFDDCMFLPPTRPVL